MKDFWPRTERPEPHDAEPGARLFEPAGSEAVRIAASGKWVGDQ